MKASVNKTKYYDRAYPDRFNTNNKHPLNRFEQAANAVSSHVAAVHDAFCVFADVKPDSAEINVLLSIGINLNALSCAGFVNDEIVAATVAIIKAIRVPAYSPQAVAEYTVSIILTFNRKNHKPNNRVEKSNLFKEKLMDFNIYGKSHGVTGTAKMGSGCCNSILGCAVIAYDIKKSTGLIAKGVTSKTIDEVLQQSNFISLPCPLSTKRYTITGSVPGMNAGDFTIITKEVKNNCLMSKVLSIPSGSKANFLY